MIVAQAWDLADYIGAAIGFGGVAWWIYLLCIYGTDTEQDETEIQRRCKRIRDESGRG